ncbi:MAG TPA: hypothetical protein PLX60_14050, partial [Chitinophagales bacterium]|nr:hypothetical protein [Chitinophagales bacterium]
NTAGYFHEWMINQGVMQFAIALFFVSVLFVTEAITGDTKIETIVISKNRLQRWTVYVLLLVSIVWFGIFNNTSFVYFQY